MDQRQDVFHNCTLREDEVQIRCLSTRRFQVFVSVDRVNEIQSFMPNYIRAALHNVDEKEEIRDAAVDILCAASTERQ